MRTVLVVDTAVGYGACQHGQEFVWLDREVVFVDPCEHGCVEVLRSEGFVVVAEERAA